MNIFGHHPEPLFPFPDFPLRKNLPRDILKDKGETFSAILKNGWDGFLFEYSCILVFYLEGNDIFFFFESGRVVNVSTNS